MSAIVVAILSAGLKDIELTTDPVELWSAPNSRARQEKDFHDENFGPFFRTNQLILTAPGRKGEEYDSLLFGKSNFSGIMSKDLIIELLELQTRIQVGAQDPNLTTEGRTNGWRNLFKASSLSFCRISSSGRRICNAMQV